jgi:peptide/nickel transport system substrate-binding protein
VRKGGLFSSHRRDRLFDRDAFHVERKQHVRLKEKLSRAEFLRFSAVAAASTIVAACTNGAATPAGGTTTAAGTTPAAAPPTPAPAAKATTAPVAPVAPAATPTAAPTAASVEIAKATAVTVASGKYKESPALAQLVKDGKLPALDQRLPANPYVVPHKWLTPGKYGGVMQWVCTDKSDWGTGHYIQESMYGHSHVRWLRDGLEIGPGLAEKWEVNADTSVWTIHFRQGLKWSDGKPWSTEDIMFWWDDEVQTPDLKELPPDDARSGKGTLMKLTAPDANTIVMTFDAPAPLTLDRLAMWVKRGIGPRWMDPKHYLQQFHTKYNTSLDKASWVDNFIEKRDFAKNPDCPTMTGWMLKTYTKGQNSVWVRNPYYWVVDKDGNQLPYIDGLTQTNVQDAEVMKLRITDGKVDYVHGGFTPLSLADVATFKAAEAKSGVETRFWDTGSGTGSMYFFSQDFAEPKMRALIRNPKFRQALSLAYNRANAQKVVYFNTGELTTGTLSPKAQEYHVEGGPEVYKAWRDSFVKFDPDTAKKMLDEIGVKQSGQWRTMPDGSPLTVTLDFPADASPTGEDLRKNELLAKDWQTIGINAKLNPVTPTSYDDQWAAGKIMMKTAWEVGDGPNHLVFPQWLVPIEATRWAPLQGKFYEVKGTPAETQEEDVDPYKRTPPRMAPDKGGAIEKIWALYDQSKIEPDQLKRTKLVWDMIKLHISDGPFFSGTAANPPRLVLVKKGLMNVPQHDDLALGGFVNPWIHPTPAVYDPEAYYWDNPSQHNT